MEFREGCKEELTQGPAHLKFCSPFPFSARPLHNRAPFLQKVSLAPRQLEDGGSLTSVHVRHNGQREGRRRGQAVEHGEVPRGELGRRRRQVVAGLEVFHWLHHLWGTHSREPEGRGLARRADPTFILLNGGLPVGQIHLRGPDTGAQGARQAPAIDD